jgi:hypothetical protein
LVSILDIHLGIQSIDGPELLRPARGSLCA